MKAKKIAQTFVSRFNLLTTTVTGRAINKKRNSGNIK